jgi:hypothetical protein
LDFRVNKEGECGIEGVGEDMDEMGRGNEVRGLIEEAAEGSLLQDGDSGIGGVLVGREHP